MFQVSVFTTLPRNGHSSTAPKRCILREAGSICGCSSAAFACTAHNTTQARQTCRFYCCCCCCCCYCCCMQTLCLKGRAVQCVDMPRTSAHHLSTDPPECTSSQHRQPWSAHHLSTHTHTHIPLNAAPFAPTHAPEAAGGGGRTGRGGRGGPNACGTGAGGAAGASALGSRFLATTAGWPAGCSARACTGARGRGDGGFGRREQHRHEVSEGQELCTQLSPDVRCHMPPRPWSKQGAVSSAMPAICTVHKARTLHCAQGPHSALCTRPALCTAHKARTLHCAQGPHSALPSDLARQGRCNAERVCPARTLHSALQTVL